MINIKKEQISWRRIWVINEQSRGGGSMRRDSSQQPVQGGPRWQRRSSPAAGPPGMEGTCSPCPGTAASLLPLTSSSWDLSSSSWPSGAFPCWHTCAVVTMSSCLQLLCPRERAPSLPVRCRIGLALWLEFSNMMIFSLCHIYFSWDTVVKICGQFSSPLSRAQPISLAWILATQMSFPGFLFHYLYLIPLLHKPVIQLCFVVWLLPFMCYRHIKSFALSLIFRSVARPDG